MCFQTAKILTIPYTSDKYLQHFVLNFLQNEQLRLNGPLVQRRKDKKRTPFVTKKSVRENIENSENIDKDWLAKFTAEHPDIFREFKKRTKYKISSVSNEEISSIDLVQLCNFLISRLSEIKAGAKSATIYHRTIVGIMELLFYPNLCTPVIEQEIHEGRKRIDIIFDNCAETGFFYRLSATHDIPCSFIAVECKNYSRDVANPELDQISGRFSPNRGKVGMIACRTIDNMDLFLKRCSDTYKDQRGLIIPLVDNDFINLLKLFAAGNITEIESFLQQRFHVISMM